MPRVDSASHISSIAPPRRNTRQKKLPPKQDRPSPRALFFRRVRKTAKPGLWILGLGAALVLAFGLVRLSPPAMPAGTPGQALPAQPHGFALAALAADLGLRITKVEVSGADSLDPASLSAAIGVQPGDPALGFSLSALQSRVAQLGPVQQVTVERRLPGTLIVTVRARDPLAIWQTSVNGQPQFALIDKQGLIIAHQDAAAAKRREPALLLLSGADAPQFAAGLMAELQAAPAVLVHVAAGEHVDGLRWNLILKNHTVVKLPADNEQSAIGQLAAMQNSMQLLDRPVEVIDLRLPGRLVVRPYAAPAPHNSLNAIKTEPAHE